MYFITSLVGLGLQLLTIGLCVFSWSGGENHLLWSVWPASGEERLGQALLVGAGLSSLVHRHKYDVSLPTPSERTDQPDDTRTPASNKPRSVDAVRCVQVAKLHRLSGFTNRNNSEHCFSAAFKPRTVWASDDSCFGLWRCPYSESVFTDIRISIY